MTQEQISEHLREIYGVEKLVELISAITDVVLEEVKAWQNRPLDRVYPIVCLDALRIKGRTNGVVITRMIYVAVNLAGKEGDSGLLGL